MHTNKLTKTIVMGLTTIMVLELTACGTIFYPERKGQKSGSIDPVVAIADAVGLLFYFLPGIIAFAVDFNNGTIYEGHGRHSSLTPEELKSISVNGKVDKKLLGEIISKKLNKHVDLEASNTEVTRFNSEASLLAYMSLTDMQQLAGL